MEFQSHIVIGPMYVEEVVYYDSAKSTSGVVVFSVVLSV